MWVYKVGRFEVGSKRDLARASVGAAAAIGLASLPRGDRVAATFARTALGLRQSIRGLHHVEADTVYLVAPLHEGFADVLMLGHLPLRLRFVARDELFDWPILGHILTRQDQIRVDPEARIGSFRTLIDEIEASVDRDESVVLFPQGSILGIEAAFRPGAFRIADRLGVPVLPVVITGTHRVWEHPYTDRLRFGQSVEMTVLGPVPVGEAVPSMSDLQHEMKRIALEEHRAPPRHFDPDRDGYWDGYTYEIDPNFAAVHGKVGRHREELKSRPV